MKKKIIYASVGLGFLTGIGGYFIENAYLQNIAVEICGLFLALAIGMTVVNVVLENKQRQSAVKSLLLLISDSINDFHNTLISQFWAKFGKDRWGEIIDEYVGANGKAEALSEEVRNEIYKIVKERPFLLEKLEKLEESMIELSRLGGWSLDPEVLGYCLDFRRSVISLKQIELDDLPETKTEVTEHLLDSDLHSSFVRGRLMDLAGIDA